MSSEGHAEPPAVTAVFAFVSQRAQLRNTFDLQPAFVRIPCKLHRLLLEEQLQRGSTGYAEADRFQFTIVGDVPRLKIRHPDVATLLFVETSQHCRIADLSKTTNRLPAYNADFLSRLSAPDDGGLRAAGVLGRESERFSPQVDASAQRDNDSLAGKIPCVLEFPHRIPGALKGGKRTVGPVRTRVRQSS